MGRLGHGLLTSMSIHPELEEELHDTVMQSVNVKSQHLAGSPLQNGWSTGQAVVHPLQLTVLLSKQEQPELLLEDEEVVEEPLDEEEELEEEPEEEEPPEEEPLEEDDDEVVEEPLDEEELEDEPEEVVEEPLEELEEEHAPGVIEIIPALYA